MKSIKKILSLLSILLVSLVLFGAVSAVSAASSVITHTYAVGINPEDIAIDTSGNVWVVNNGNGTAGTAVGDSNVTELSPNGRGGYTSATYTAGSSPYAIAIDTSGDVWVTNDHDQFIGTASRDSHVTELSPSGKLIGTYTAGSNPRGIAIDAAGNVWVTNAGNGVVGNGNFVGVAKYYSCVTELSSSGKLIGTYNAGSTPEDIAIDAAGNVWIVDRPYAGSSGLTELNSFGDTVASGNMGFSTWGIAIGRTNTPWVTIEGSSVVAALNYSSLITHGMPVTYTTGGRPMGIAIDASGNVWVVNNGNGTAGTAVGDSNVMELRPNGRGGYTSATTYTAGIYPDAIAIDASGNVWVVNRGNNGTVGTAIGDSNVTELVRAAKGPQFWPYSGPQFPGGGNY